MNAERQELYVRMGQERVNVEIMFARDDDEDPVISCRLREWSAGRNAGRMILAGGRTVDEAIAYAYHGLCENHWIPLDWRLRAVGIGTVYGVVTPIVPVRRPIDVSAILRRDDDWLEAEVPDSRGNGPQNGAQRDPERKNGKRQGQPTA